ncbi:Utp11-domain-containing protein [Tilletiaria anomala UBC 951]|uniref:Utp11-domain-containing protein n=1 Tax=Tilletiaria anomala (strain ATCC 24038 / CBS 436.72 / UBC 951) TaxID=1037660 RepID=A0A066W574_TILAU|nr:Utp11-domain-containing protein [Tilletiaria anomala UBC 951]KDN45910.1 Utp11-domain-containing protein [Tilletiaria anomala UBC 951]
MALRNAVHRRNHKERSQLASRKHLGLLEKHKDYVQRAADHHSKRERIKRLREKAGMRNKDEFYFGMVNSRTQKGVHIASRPSSVALSTPLVQLLKTQDASLIRHQLRQEQKRLEKLIARVAPAVPGMRLAWLEVPIKKDYKERNRKEVLQDAGLLVKEQVKGKGKGKAKAAEHAFDEEEERDGGQKVVGLAGKKTIWCDSTDELRNYASIGFASSSHHTGPEVTDARPGSDGHNAADWDDMSDLDASALDDDDDDASSSHHSNSSGAGQDEKYLSHLLLLLSARQERQEALSEAASKLALVRNLMSSRGNSARNVTDKNTAKKAQMVDLVANGKMTSNGLALPGNEDEDDAVDTEGGKGKSKLKVFKWSRERKR